MIDIHTVSLANASLCDQVSTSKMTLHYAILVVTIVSAVHTTNLFWGAVRRRIAHRAALRKARTALAAGGVEHELRAPSPRDAMVIRLPVRRASLLRDLQMVRDRRYIRHYPSPRAVGSPSSPDHR